MVQFSRLSVAVQAGARCLTGHPGAVRLGLPALLLLAANCCAVSLPAQQPASGAKHESRIVKSSQKGALDADAMVEALANHNPVPKLAGPDHSIPVFDKKYDWSEQEKDSEGDPRAR